MTTPNFSKPWTREDLMLVINLYCKTPFGKIHTRNPDIIKLADILGRTAGSVSYKLANFASIDPSLDRQGAGNVSKLDVEVWSEFFNDWNNMAFASEELLSNRTGEKPEVADETFPAGKSKESLVKVRVNQSFFRKAVLSSYNSECCITGINIPQLLVASHIIPWSVDSTNQTNPRNGLCLNSLHDKAFDNGFFTVDSSFKIIMSSRLNTLDFKSVDFFHKYEGRIIRMPSRFLPDQSFLEYHRREIFIQ